MAKRKRRVRKDAPKKHELPGGFWRQVVAVLMLALAVMLILTWFGNGGSLLNKIHQGSFWLIGMAGYLVPTLLIYLTVKIFRSEDNRLPTVIWVAMILMIVWVAGLFGLPTINQPEPMGGVVGEALNDLVVQILAPSVAGFFYLILIFITTLFILQISPATAFRMIRATFATTRKKEDSENLKVAKAANSKVPEDLEIKVNSGVSIVEQKDGDKTFKPVRPNLPTVSSAAVVSAPKSEPEKALIAVSDPNWKMPPVDLLEKKQASADPGSIKQNAFIIKSTLAEFGIDVEMEGANVGPRVTQYTMRPPSGVNLSKIVSRDRELALNLAIDKVRIEAPIPGTRSVGVEIPNVRPAEVRLRGVIESPEWKEAKDPLTFAVGKDISGKSVVANLAKMPHLLIAGTTGSGKSVMTNTLISSLLYRNAPSD
ncbi:MAG: DNA translocase FtsK 4TM domain-containing protein, partial [Candidatus Saccharibacteria bacterium]|nr:DNA translocase FtsK 4TM domain-containing protein [Candidatus Saccharibacteria bacterium]